MTATARTAVITICVLCTGTRRDRGVSCPRCHGTGRDPGAVAR